MKRLLAIVLPLVVVGAAPQAKPVPPDKVLTERDCTVEKLGSAIPANAIGEPVSSVTLSPPEWHGEANSVPAYCAILGLMAPIDKSDSARPIRFGVTLPASWSRRAAQLGGSGMNGSIPN